MPTVDNRPTDKSEVAARLLERWHHSNGCDLAQLTDYLLFKHLGGVLGMWRTDGSFSALVLKGSADGETAVQSLDDLATKIAREEFDIVTPWYVLPCKDAKHAIKLRTLAATGSSVFD